VAEGATHNTREFLHNLEDRVRALRAVLPRRAGFPLAELLSRASGASAN